MKSDQEIDEALAEEFSGYLKSVSKEIVQPIREETKKHKSEIDRLTASIDQAGVRLGSLLESHHDQLSSEGQSLLASLDDICKQMREIVQGVSSANEVTRERLLAEASTISSAVGKGITGIDGAVHGMRMALDQSLSQLGTQAEPWIGKAGESIESAMTSRIGAAEVKLQSVLERSMYDNVQRLEATLSDVNRLRYWLVAVCILQVATFGALWVLR